MSTHRKVPLVTEKIYHVFNRGIDKRKTFTDQNEYNRAFQTLSFYQSSSPPINLSRYLQLGNISRQELKTESWGSKIVSIFCYCFMPNHVHLLLRQEEDCGISNFMGLFFNSYTRYFNIKHERTGGLFLDDFQNVLVKSEEQLLHLSRYIHLNPYSSGLTKTMDDLKKYTWSSLDEYISSTGNPICDKKMIMSYFSDKNSYWNFVKDRADYQKKLKMIETITLENSSTRRVGGYYK